jgi:molybdopterin-guanine dinucleotide biosynthesis protein A
MNTSHDIFGLVLSGGRSTRMGSDKGSVIYNGMPQREFLFQCLKKYCAQVYTSCHTGQPVAPELNPLEDQFDMKSPMNGILSAFEKHPDVAWLVVAVDMPYVDERVLEQLIAARNTIKVATCFYNEKGEFPEPLLTLWETKAFPLLLEFTEKGRISPKDFLTDNDVHMIIPENPVILININDKEEYLKFKRPG